MSLLTMLQSRKKFTAEQMAKRFDVSIRTIYRDLRTLEEAGVPIGAEAGIGYFLADGYTLPPLNIKEEEAFAVITAQKFIENQGDQSLKDHYKSLTEKVGAILKPKQKEKLELLSERLAPSQKKETAKSKDLSIIQSALSQREVLEIGYRGGDQKYTERPIEPLAIYYTLEAWILVAQCRLRNDLREFRLDRIQTIKNTHQEFAPRFFRLEDYFKKV